MFKIIGRPRDGQKNLCLVCQVMHSLSQICKEEQKPCCGRGQGWLSFLDKCPKYFFFQLPKLNKYCLGVVLGPTHQLIKKLKMDHLNGSNKKGMPITEILNTCTQQTNKHLLEISCKNKVLIKSYCASNRGTNFWDTLYCPVMFLKFPVTVSQWCNIWYRQLHYMNNDAMKTEL